MSFKKFLVDNKIISESLINEVFKSNALKRIIDAAKISSRLEDADYASKTKEITAHDYDFDYSKDYSSSTKHNTYKASGFKKLNKILYAATGFAELSEVPYEMFTIVPAEEAKRYKDENQIKFFLGEDENTGAEQLVGIVRGSNDVIYSKISLRNFSPYHLHPQVSKDGEIDAFKSGHHKTDREHRLDRMEKSTTSKYSSYRRADRSRGRYYSSYGREQIDHTDTIPSQKKMIEMSTECIIMDLTAVKNMNPESGYKKHAGRMDQRKGVYVPSSKLKGMSDDEKYAFKDRITDDDIASANLKRYSEMKNKNLLPSDFEERYNSIIDKITAFRKSNIKDGDSLLRLVNVERKLNEKMQEMYYDLRRFIDSQSEGKYVKQRVYANDNGESEIRTKWNAGWESDRKLESLKRTMESLEQLVVELIG